MATAQMLLGSERPSRWFLEFLKHELAPYPRRAAIVTRMVVATGLVMLICVTYRIPFAFQGAIFVLLISRESIRATLQTSATILLVTAVTAAYLLAGAWFVAGLPEARFLWIVASLFLAFYAISALTNYLMAVVFATVIAVGTPLWDRHVPAETNVEDTLWLCLAALVGAATTAVVELAFAKLRPGDPVILALTERLSAMGDLLTCYAEGCAADSALEQKILRFEVLGTSRLRRIMRRSDRSSQYRTTMAGVTVLVGRLVDLAAALTQIRSEPSDADRERFRNLGLVLATIREDLKSGRIPGPVQIPEEGHAGAVPLLGEMEETAALIPRAFADSGLSLEYLPSSGEKQRRRFTLPVAGALFAPEHFRFGLKGCLAASACYVIYNAVDWPGISTSVTTCLLTGLSTVGASRQKQILRLTGAIVGGFVIGMGSQIFILPYIDSITGFLVLFVAVTTFAAWFLTSSPRLSYFGLQVALAFYLINLEEFRFQTSLETARDRVVGILLGLFLMWLVFDQLWGARAGVEMKRSFVANLRLIAQFAREPLLRDQKAAIERGFALRETINRNLDRVSSLGDGVLFEFGPMRQQDLALRERIRKWQPQLRTLFLMRTTLLKYRLRLPGFELPEPIERAQQEFDEQTARMLDAMAGRLEGRVPGVRDEFVRSFERLDQALQTSQQEAGESSVAAHLETFLPLCRTVEGLILSLDAEVV
jgi:multidrug resistance protein MdtO